MSMLLEALKKSEEQRQLGSTPDIHQAADHDPDAGAGMSLPWIPILLAAVAVSVMAWFGWSQLRAPEGSIAESSPAQVQPAQGQAESAAPVAAPEAQTARQPRTMVEQYSSASPGKAATQPEAQTNDQRKKDVTRSFNQFAAKPSTQKTTPDAGAAAESQPPAEVAVPVEPTDRRPPMAEDISRAQSASKEPWESEAMSYWALPQGVRDSLPEFRITVLVFADEPEDRFLLINGMRLKEKDELQSGVVLDEIRREGAVFRARNYRFLVRGG